MLSLRAALQQSHTTTARGLRSSLSSQRSSVVELLRTNQIHQRYLSTGGFNGPFGYPVSEVQFLGHDASRQFTAGSIRMLGGNVVLGDTLAASVRFLGFRCVQE